MAIKGDRFFFINRCLIWLSKSAFVSASNFVNDERLLVNVTLRRLMTFTDLKIRNKRYK